MQHDARSVVVGLARERLVSNHSNDSSQSTRGMGSVSPLTYLLLIVSGWVHRRQLLVIDFLQAENRLLTAPLSGKSIRFTQAQRALLARKSKALGRKALLELDTLVSPDTRMRWHRRLVAHKSDFSKRRGPAVRASCARSHG
jgi:hypothetical protein